LARIEIMNDLANAPYGDNRNQRQLVPVAEALPALRELVNDPNQQVQNHARNAINLIERKN